MRHISEEEISAHLSMPQVVDLMEEVFMHPEKGDMPPKIYLENGLGGNDFRAMPARFGDFAGIKWAALFPHNSENGYGPSVSATITLNSLESGRPLAIMDGMLITSYRTAAVTGLATKYLSRSDSEVAAFVGCGFQTEFQIEAVLNAREIKKIKLFDLNKARCESLAEKFDIPYCICDSVRECVWGSDIVTTLTPSRKAFIESDWIGPGMHINAVGADAEGKQEFEDNIARVCSVFVVDDRIQAFHSGEAQHSKNKDSMYDLFEIVQHHGWEPEFATKDTISFFDSTGLAIEDIALAGQIYQKLEQQSE